MADEKLLELICCPETQQELSFVDSETLLRLNDLQADGRLLFRNGNTVGYKLSGALVRADGQVIYPIREEIPVLLTDESIAAENPGGVQ